MSILRDPLPDAQALAARLTTYQRMILGKAGMPRWFDLAYPWEPAPGRQTEVAHQLTSPVFGLLRLSPSYVGGYEHTPLGERVAAVFLEKMSHAQEHAFDLAYSLTPIQRSVLCLVAVLDPVAAGELDSLQQIVVAAGLANPEYALLNAQDIEGQVHFLLTSLGVEVVEELLVGVLHD